MTVGPLVGAVGVALLARIGPGASYLTDVLGPMTLLGAGLALTVTPLTATVLAAVPGERSGLASGVNNAVARTGGLLAVAVLPVLTGLGADGFGDARTLAPAFRSAVLICAALLVLGAAISWLTLRPGRLRAADRPTCPTHCAVDGPPVTVPAARPRPGGEPRRR
jgi:hypothetical protein